MSQPNHSYHASEIITVPSSQLMPGATTRMSLQSLTDRHAGEPRHLVALVFKGTLKLTVGAAVNGQTNYAAHVHRALRNIRFVVADHEHLVDVDGEDLIIDEAIRTGRFRPDDYTYATLATGTQSVQFAAALRLDNPRASDEMRHDETIPCALFEDTARSYLEFVVASDLGMGTDLAIHSDGFTSLTVQAVTVARNDLVRPTPWRLRSYSTSELVHAIEPKGALRYLVNINRGVSTLAQVSHASTDFQRFMIGGESVNGVLTIDQYIEMARIARPTAADGSLAAIGWRSAPSTSVQCWTGAPLVLPASDVRATKLPRGRVDVSLGSMPAGYNSRIRYLYRETGVVTLDHEDRVLSALRLDPSETTVEVKAAAGRGMAAQGILPARIRSARLRYAGPAARSVR